MDCPRLQRVVSGRALALTRKMAASHGIELDAEAERKLTESFAETLKDYMAEARLRNDKMTDLEARLIEFLVGKKVDREKARDFIAEWMDQTAGLIDTRFPVIPLGYEIPYEIRPHWDLVRATVASKDWKSMSATARANSAATYRAKEKATRNFAEALPADHVRRKPLLAEADSLAKRAEAFEKVAEWETALYKEVAPVTTRGYPYGFATKFEFDVFSKSFVEGFKKDLGAVLKAKAAETDLADARFFLMGSVLTGLSHERKADGLRRPFGPHSDLDIVIVLPDKAFQELRRKGLMKEEEPALRSIPYSLEATPEAIREMGLEPLLKNMGEGLAVKKISISFYSESYYERKQDVGPYEPLTRP